MAEGISTRGASVPLEEVEVLIEHPYGDIWMPLLTWIDDGPGPRPFLHPTAARHRVTGTELPMAVVPWRYRNTLQQLGLRRLRLLSDPRRRRTPT